MRKVQEIEFVAGDKLRHHSPLLLNLKPPRKTRYRYLRESFLSLSAFSKDIGDDATTIL